MLKHAGNMLDILVSVLIYGFQILYSCELQIKLFHIAHIKRHPTLWSELDRGEVILRIELFNLGFFSIRYP